MLEKVKLVCPRCGNGNYMRSLRGIDPVYQFKCINCNSYFKNEDFAKSEKTKTNDIGGNKHEYRFHYGGSDRSKYIRYTDYVESADNCAEG